MLPDGQTAILRMFSSEGNIFVSPDLGDIKGGVAPFFNNLLTLEPP